MRTPAPLAAALALVPLALPASAQCWEQTLSVEPADTRLSGGLAAANGVLAFGQPKFGSWGVGALDAVHVFEGSPGAYAFVTTLHSPTATGPTASFGLDVDTDGRRIVVGDPAANSVHVFVRGASGWTLGETIRPVGPVSFGERVLLDGDRMLVSAPFTTTGSGTLEDGAVYVYRRGAAGWSIDQEIVSPVPGLFNGFGKSFDLDGNRLVIGSPGDSLFAGTPSQLDGSGGVHVFERASHGAPFVYMQPLMTSLPLAGASLGASVAVRGNLIATGAIGEVVAGEFAAGRVHVFESVHGAWFEVDVLEADPIRAYHRFGTDVAWTDLDELLVTSDAGSDVTRFTRTPQALGFDEDRVFHTNAGVAWPVGMPIRAIEVEGAIVATDPAGATVFAADAAGDVAVGCDGLPIPVQPPFVGFPVYLDLRDEPRHANGSITFTVFGGSSAGLLFYGFQPASSPLGSGELCVGGTLARAATGTQASLHVVEATLDLTSGPATGGATAILPGVPVHFQYWFRLNGGGSHTTNSLVVEFCP